MIKFQTKPWVLALCTAATVFSGTLTAQEVKPTRIRGEIVAVDSTTLTVHRRSGDTVKIAI